MNFTEYRLGSLFALGELYRAKGQVDEALNYFLEALKIIDLGTVSRDQADDLIKVYESLAETYATKGEAQQAGTFVNTLVDFLSSKGWADKVAQARRRLDSLTEEGAPAISLAEILSLRDSDALLQSLSLMQELAKRGKYYSALEEAYLAIQRAPDYLPLHLRMAEMMYKNNQTEAAIDKFLTIANTMAARGDNHQAMAIYQRILRLAPMDVNIRTRLIEMLVSYGQIDRALEQYLALADTYYQLASHREGAREISGSAGAGAARHHQPLVDQSDHAQAGRAGYGTRRLAARAANLRADQEDRSVRRKSAAQSGGVVLQSSAAARPARSR